MTGIYGRRNNVRGLGLDSLRYPFNSRASGSFYFISFLFTSSIFILFSFSLRGYGETTGLSKAGGVVHSRYPSVSDFTSSVSLCQFYRIPIKLYVSFIFSFILQDTYRHRLAPSLLFQSCVSGFAFCGKSLGAVL